MTRISRRCAQTLLLVAGIAWFSDGLIRAQPRTDPWGRLKYSTAWIQLGDFSDTTMTAQFLGDPSWPLFSGGPYLPLFTGVAQLPEAGDILEVKASVPLWIADFRNSGETRRIVLARVTPALDAKESRPEFRTGPRTRWMPAGPVLANRIEPGDEIVDVTKIEIVDYISFDGEQPEETIARLIGYSNAVVMARVTAIEPFFSEDDGWIDRRIRATAVEILKNQSVLPGRTFEALSQNGEMRIGGALVTMTCRRLRTRSIANRCLRHFA